MNRTNFESNPGRFQERIDGSLGGRGRANRSFISAHKRTISRAISQIGKANRDSKMPRFARSNLCISLPKRYPVTRVSPFSASLLSYETMRKREDLLLPGWERRRAAGKSDAASSRRRVYKRDESAKRIIVKGAPTTLRVETFNLRVRQSIVTGD